MVEEISYEYLFDLLRREKTKEDLQSIDKNFYNHAFSSLTSREVEIRQKELQKSLVMNADLEKEKIEIRNIRKILNEIKGRRQKKIILLALSRVRIPSTIINHELFTAAEDKFFNTCVLLFRDFRQDNHSPIENSEEERVLDATPEVKVDNSEPEIEKTIKPEVEKESKTEPVPEKVELENVKVQFLTDMPNFYGPKKELLGPFKKDDTFELPEIIAKILINKGRAKKI